MLKNLNPRERFLVILVLIAIPVALVPLGGLYLWQGLADKQRQLIGLQKRKSDLELNQLRWVRAENRRNELRRLSLVDDPEASRSIYRDWLLTTSADVFGEEAVRVSHVSDSPRRHEGFDVFRESNFSLKTTGTLAQLMDFLERFYRLDCLHRITGMTVKPIVDVQKQEPTKRLTLSFDIAAIAVAGAEARESLIAPVPDVEADLASVDGETFKQWRDSILRRNVFGLPNNPPTFSRVGTRRFKVGEKMELTLSARDDDEGDALSFTLVESPMADVKLESSGRGSAKLLLPELGIGRYRFTVAVSDDGLPAKTATQVVEVEVEKPDPPKQPTPPEPPFDPSVATYVTAVVKDRTGVRNVFIDIKPEGKTLRLSEGMSFEVGTIKGTVLELTAGKALIEIDGDLREFRPGDPITGGR